MDEYPLDPLPYRCGLKRPVDDVRHPERDVWSCSDPIFEPRPGYEKSRAAYGLSDDVGQERSGA